MEVWVGPVIIAAIVSGLVSALGWFVNSWQERQLERRRREEKVHDFQVALRAEVASDLLVMQVADNSAMFGLVRDRYQKEPGYRPFVPHLAANVIFEAIVDEIHVLPGDVIEPIIHYARLRQVLSKFTDDLRQAVGNGIPAERAVLMFSDYFDTLGRLEILAEHAVAALDASLSRPGAARPNQASASGPDGGSASALSERKGEP